MKSIDRAATSDPRYEDAQGDSSINDILRLARLSANVPFAQLCIGADVVAWSSESDEYEPLSELVTIAELHPPGTIITLEGDLPTWARTMQAISLTGPNAESVYLLVVSGQDDSLTNRSLEALDAAGSLVEQVLDRWVESERLGDVSARLRDSQDELRRSGEQLEISNRELEQFAYVASHELVAPLRAVSVYAQLLGQILSGAEVDPATATKVDSCIGEITRGVGLMSNQVQSLLELSSVNSTKAETEPVSIAEVVSNALDTLAPQIEEAEATVTVEKLPVVDGLLVPLQSVFANLISNSLRYRHPERQLEIVVSNTDDGPSRRITVQDNGVGVTEADEDRIFALFERASTDTDGTGIGLALSRRIVESFGGSIGVESGVEDGSVFWVEFPDAA